ncbi:MAG TPA: hypothetical protein VG096_23635 [Bryobacteraceae bacterium]|jgi:hypothetical protein|nr:hypothetical protein [Bryobacteraceae bacterium]
MCIYKWSATAALVAFASLAAAQAPSYQQAARLPARILSFTAEPASIQPDGSVTLRWAVENPLGTTIDPSVGVVTPRGGRRLSPSATTTYTLTVRGPNNQVITKDVTVTVAGTTPVAAKTEPTKKELARLDGKPDLSGVYGFAMGRGAGANAMPLKPEAEKLKVVHGPDYAGLTADCMPLGVPGSFNVPYPFQIIQAPKTITIFYEYPNTFRIIPTDGRPHPDDVDPTWMGNSVGHWEGDTLVVDTIGLNTKTELNGYRHSEAMHVVERLQRLESGDLQYDVTIEEPSLFTKPWVMPTRTFPFRSELEKIDEFVCENNRDYSGFFKK